jgi:hypothetical protein
MKQVSHDSPERYQQDHGPEEEKAYRQYTITNQRIPSCDPDWFLSLHIPAPRHSPACLQLWRDRSTSPVNHVLSRAWDEELWSDQQDTSSLSRDEVSNSTNDLDS